MYFVHNSGGSTTCESPSNTAIRFVAMMMFPLFRTAPLSTRQFSRSQPFRARVALPAHRGLRLERLLALFLGWPPVGPLDLGHAVANKLLGRLDVIHAARVVSEKLRLVRLGQLAFPHRLHCPPRVVTLAMVPHCQPRPEDIVELGKPRQRGT